MVILAGERLEALEVKVDGARADDATAGERNARPFQPPQQRAHDANRAAHFAHQIVIAVAFDLARLDAHGAVLERDRGAEPVENLRHEPHVAEVGHAMDDARLGREQRRGHDRERGVFCPADPHLALQGHAAFDEQTVHER